MNMSAKFMFYPGCSLEAGGGYLESVHAVSKILDVDLTELPDWNCCGSTMLKAFSRNRSAVMAARNFSLAKRNGVETLIVVCNACLSMLTDMRNILREDSELAARAEAAMKAAGHELFLDIQIKHILDVYIEDVGLERIRSLVKRPLAGQSISAYYGCLYSRPGREGVDRDAANYLEKLIAAIGGEALDFSARKNCCGVSQGVTHPEVGKSMRQQIVTYAARKGAGALMTICPMCNFNLEVVEETMVPHNPDVGVLFFTQAMGLAFGMTAEELGTGKLLNPPVKVINGCGASA
jgi:heterodisulfide reductase subunit B